ncbi:swr1 complex component, partial [Ascosphaera atra]
MHDEQDREIEMEKEQRLEAEDEESAPVCTKAQSHAVHDTHTAMGQEHKQKESLPSFVPPSKQIGQQENPPADKEDKPASEDDGDLDIKTPIPHLLRGTLRKYQHYGLDWLAGLYNNNINGILADEMGLGKTIQTIALLAHLAVEHEVWGPHLVVVPTSVMLNWEMEFKKWAPGFKILTYYGSQEERRQKRRGWMDDDRWHVCITSYQLVLQDQQTFKRRNWHYMILDEAHNIKNFRSQRWQTLLTFKTHSRLLLTGTPLQNNLTELWSLLFFLMPSDDEDMGIEGFADLRNFSEWFRRPVEQILEHGRETMDDEAKQVVSKLHTVLRPYILRRLKIDVEKQMPAKYEHVVLCRLSKRQRYLYDGFMSRAQTRETLASGNYLSIINCLMQLRKVCNHPDLFETRPITTSFAMPRSAVAEFEINELLVRRRLLKEQPGSKLDLDFLNLAPISDEHISKLLARDTHKIAAAADTALAELARKQREERTIWDMQFNGSTVESALSGMENAVRKARAEELK